MITRKSISAWCSEVNKMLLRRFDGAFSRMVRSLIGGAPSVPSASLDDVPQESNLHSENNSQSPGNEPGGQQGHESHNTVADATNSATSFLNPFRWMPAGVRAGLDFARQCAGFVGGLEQGDARVRWLELRNKIAAYRHFEGSAHAGQDMGLESISTLEPYSRMFAAEGFAYRNVRPGALLPELPPQLSPISIHAGAGLCLAEQALENIHSGRCEAEVLREFAAVCQRDGLEGFRGIVEEALGLVARTLYPHLMERLDACLRTMNAEFCERFWHGAGRGIYFAPSNVPFFRAAPWSGVAMCIRESPNETARRNVLSGFCFAVTFINLRQPEVLETFFKHHATQVDEGMGGVQAAVAIWTISGGDNEAGKRMATYTPTVEAARMRWDLLRPREVSELNRNRPERLFSARVMNGN